MAVKPEVIALADSIDRVVGRMMVRYELSREQAQWLYEQLRKGTDFNPLEDDEDG